MVSALGGCVGLSGRQARALFRLLFGDAPRAEAMALGEPWKGMAVRLLGADVGDRPALWQTLTAELAERDRALLIEKLGGVAGAVPDGPSEPRPRVVAEELPREPPRVVGRPDLGGSEQVEPESGRSLGADGLGNNPRVEKHILNDASCDEPTTLPISGISAWPEPLAEAALQGMAGQVVQAIEPNTEADPAAILLQFLVGFGNLVGRGPFIEVDGHEHHANLFAVVVGDTSRARKGTSWRRVRALLADCDRLWAADRLLGGLSSGEGLIWAVRDAVFGVDKKSGEDFIIHRAVDDKRLLVVESEFGGALRVLGREGSTLSAILRQAYDGDDLRFLTKNNPAAATAPHVSLCGHVTREELQKHLSSVEAFNGLGNRILWTCARRSKGLPFGGGVDPKILEAMGTYLAGLADDARQAGQLTWAPSGAKLWEFAYDDLTTSHPGLLARSPRGPKPIRSAWR